MKYRVIGADDAASLEEKVNAAIVEGWEPLGGVSTSMGVLMEPVARKGYDEVNWYYHYAQAMTLSGI